MLTPVTRPVCSLYVHVPFCARKCSYCAFYSEASDGALVGRFVAALGRELARLPHTGSLQTVFFGGGTPSLLNLAQWDSVLQAMGDADAGKVSEWTIECNPATVSLDKVKLWREHGVNRVSLGVQSFEPALLDRLGRVHTREMALRSYDILRRGGFENINVDLMFAIPGQTVEMWRETLRQALSLGTEHLSCYEVIYEEDTPLFEDLKAGAIQPDEDVACEMYEMLLEKTAEAGLVQYEVANFARHAAGRVTAGNGEDPPGSCGVEEAGAVPVPGWACRHNINYWRGGSYYGLGPSAAGFLDQRRVKNVANTRLYCERIEQGLPVVEWTEELPPVQRAGEIAAFGLRMNAGWPFATFLEATGWDLREHWNREMASLVECGWGILSKEGFRLSSAGMRFADAAGGTFLRPEAC